MVRTAINGGCKVTSGATAVDTAGFGKVTLIYADTNKAVSVKSGATSATVTASAADWVIDPATGAKAGANPPASLILSYVGADRYIIATDAMVLLSEPGEY